MKKIEKIRKKEQKNKKLAVKTKNKKKTTRENQK